MKNIKEEPAMRLLIAEDEKDLNQVITKTLQKNHYSVDSCLDGQEALDCLDMAEYLSLIHISFFPAVKIKIGGQDLFFLNPQRIGTQFFQAVLLFFFLSIPASIKRKQIHLRVIGKSFVDFPVKMDGYIGNDA